MSTAILDIRGFTRCDVCTTCAVDHGISSEEFDLRHEDCEAVCLECRVKRAAREYGLDAGGVER